MNEQNVNQFLMMSSHFLVVCIDAYITIVVDSQDLFQWFSEQFHSLMN